MTVHPYFKRPHTESVVEPWDVPALCAAYDWPTGLAGGGVIAIVEMGGGYLASDMAQFFAGIGQPVPSITDVSVDGATSNSPGQSDADYEVALDIQVAAASYHVATGKPAEIRVYWDANSIANAVYAAITDGCDVLSCSWGDDEAAWGRSAVHGMENAAIAAAAAGMIVFAASGDNDSSDGGPNAANVDCPASCPHVVGCGGTTKPRQGEEVVWNNDPGNTDGSGTGGGYSTIFARPPWQRVPPLPLPQSQRMVPDVAGNADPNSGYNVVVAGVVSVVGGTSAVAPLYAGLFAAFGRKLGFATRKIYRSPECFTDVTVGSNGTYDAVVGPDACTGMGSPLGTKLAERFSA